MAQVGLNQSLTDRNTKDLPRNRGPSPGTLSEQLIRTRRWAGLVGSAGSPRQFSGLMSWTPDPGEGDVLPTFPLTGLQHLVPWKCDSIVPFHPYNVLVENKLFILENLQHSQK